MTNPKTLNRSFAGGEISQEMFGRIDDAKYQAGAALLSNFVVTPQGPVENRAGFAYVRATKNNGVARLLPFIFSPEQTMVIELGAGYFRFHTEGETLLYSTAGMAAWTPSSGAITITSATPATITWTAHGLTTGQSIRFYLYGGAVLSDLPTGLKTGYTYTVVVVDANTFTLLDNGVQVNISATAGAGTNYPGAGTTAVTADAYPPSVVNDTSATLTGLGSHAVTGGIAQVNVTIGTDIFINSGVGGGSVYYQYNVGSGWVTFHTVTSTSDLSTIENISVPVAMADINQLQLRIQATATATLYDAIQAHGEIDAWSVDAPTVAVSSFTGVRAYRLYSAGDMVSYGGSSYIALVDNNGGLTTPGTDATIWSLLPASLIYEVPNSYAEADLFDIHYTQSADVMTLVHPSYPPAELRRLSASVWTFANIAFGQTLSPPSGVAVVASPGFIAKVSSLAGATYTTATSHTLAYGDPVYAIALGGGDGFYLVSDVPLDGSGNPIKNQLKLMDYNGDSFSGAVGANATLQYGSKIINITNYYVVTAIGPDGIAESAVSSEVSALCNLNVTGSYNTISWSAAAGASRYYVYKKKNGLYGFIGETTALTFSDNNIAPDFSITPPIFDTVFASANNYPGAVAYYDQRRSMAGTTNEPQDVRMTKTGTESDFSYSIPVKDTDRIAFRVAAREANKILHLVPLNDLILLTNSTEYRVFPPNGDALTPTNLSAKPQSYIGASTVQPNVINNSLVYCAARGGHVREMGYSWQSNGFVTGDLSLRAKHLFDNLTIVDQCFAKCPVPIVWFVSSNGELLGLTYIPEEQVGAWHHHSTDGFFESIAAVPEGNEDRLYAVIRRTINGSTVRYIERMGSRLIDEEDTATWFFVDAGSTYNAAPATVISGLTHLEGETVSILADGAVHASKTVTAGVVTLDRAASIVHIGLPYNSDLQSLPLSLLRADAFGQGRTKNINKVWVRVFKSSSVSAGPDEDNLTEAKQRTTEVYGTPPDLRSDLIEITLKGSWQDEGQVYVRQSNPLPLTVAAIVIDASVGG
jgi:hypothetical protein